MYNKRLKIKLPCKARLSIICPENVTITIKEEIELSKHTEAVLEKYFDGADAYTTIVPGQFGRVEHVILDLEYTVGVLVKYEDDFMEDFDNIDFDVIEDENGTLPDKILNEILDFAPIAGKSKDEFEYDETDFRTPDSLEDCFRKALQDLETDAAEMEMD